MPSACVWALLTCPIRSPVDVTLLTVIVAPAMGSSSKVSVPVS